MRNYKETQVHVLKKNPDHPISSWCTVISSHMRCSRSCDSYTKLKKKPECLFVNTDTSKCYLLGYKIAFL